MIIPLRTDRRLKSHPWMTQLIILANLFIFALTFSQVAEPWSPVYHFLLDPEKPQWYQYFTYLFLHGHAIRLFFNMFFLYTFGPCVEDRLGKIGFVGFYLLGGIVVGMGYTLLGSVPVLGAGGPVCAIAGAYLALVPRSKITAFYFIIVTFGILEIHSTLVVLFQFCADVIFWTFTSPQMRIYGAHLLGYLFGFGSCMAMLRLGVLAREPYDMFSLIEHRRRRVQLREAKLQEKEIGPWINPGRRLESADPLHAPPTLHQIQVMDLRARIVQHLAEQRFEEAADDYARLIDLDPAQVMGRQQQFDLANQLMAAGNHQTAARAYELFLTAYRSDAQKNQVELMLALIYTRYIPRHSRANELLQTIMPRMSDRDQIELAQILIAELGSRETS